MEQYRHRYKDIDRHGYKLNRAKLCKIRLYAVCMDMRVRSIVKPLARGAPPPGPPIEQLTALQDEKNQRARAGVGYGG